MNYEATTTMKLFMKTLNNPNFPTLATCMVLDAVSLIGLAMGQYQALFKIIWAPIAALIYFRLYGGKLGFFGGATAFLEESTGFGFIIPTFTITWFAKAKTLAKERQAAYNN